MQLKLQEATQFIRSNPPNGTSELSLAETARDALEVAFGAGNVVSTGNAIYYYDSISGLWAQLSEMHLMSLVSTFDRKKVKSSKISMSAAKLRGIIACLKILPGVAQEDFFDTPISGVALINTVLMCTKDGITETAASPNHRLRSCLPHTYSASIMPTKWLALLDQAFSADEDKADKIAVIQEFLGAALIGQAPRFDKCLIFIGSGANGKSTLLDVIQLLVDNYSSISPQKWEDEYYIAMLDGKLLNLVSEMPDTKLVHNEQFKAIVSGESVMSRAPYELPQRMRPIAGHIFAANELPPTDDNADGFWRRFIVLSFNRVFGGTGRTRHQIREEVRPEVPGIIKWCLDGAVRLLQRGEYTNPSSHKTTLENWREESDSVAAWAKYHAKPLQLPDGDISKWLKTEGFRSSSARNFYVNWCVEEGHKPVGGRKFKHRMEALGYLYKRLETGIYWAIRIEVISDQAGPAVDDTKILKN